VVDKLLCQIELTFLIAFAVVFVRAILTLAVLCMCPVYANIYTQSKRTNN